VAPQASADAATLVQHAEFVRSLARSLVRGDDLAEDVAQDTYLAALDAPPGEVRRPRAWLASVARNMARRIRRREARLDARHRAAPGRSGPESPAEVVGREESLRRVTAAVLALSDEQREVVLLRYYEGATPAQIAQRLGVPLETVRSRLRRALERLRRRLDDEWGGDRRAWVAALLPWVLAARTVAPLTGLLLAVGGLAAVAAGLWIAIGVGRGDEPSRSNSVDTAAVPTAAPASLRAPALFGGAHGRDAGTGTLLGRVRLEADGAPAEGAKVRVLGPGAGGKATAAEVATAGGGEFRLLDVPAGDEYVVEVAAAGSPKRLVPGVVVLPGRVTRLGTIWLGERAVLAVRVVDDVDGAVVGADVRVWPDVSFLRELMQDPIGLLAGLDAHRPAAAAVRSDATGLARIEGLAPGAWVVAVRVPGSAVQVERVLATVGTTEVPVRMRSVPPFSGTVVGEDGRGVEGARLAVVGGGLPHLAGIATGETGPDGAFLLRSPPAATSYAVLVAAPGRSTMMLRNVDPRTEARIVLRPGVPLEVRVTSADGSTPAENARVLVVVESRGLSGLFDEMHIGTTDASGRLAFTAQPGTISLAHAAHPTLGSGWWSPEGADTSIQPAFAGFVEGSIGHEGRSIALALSRGIDVRGRVTDEQGTAIAGALVEAIGGALLGAGGPTITDADGRYVLRGRRPGLVLVGVQAQGLAQEGESYVAKEAPDAEGVVTHDVVLARAGLVTGRVLGPGGKPVAGAEVSTSAGGAFFTAGDSTSTDAEGRYVLEGLSRESTAEVSARARGLTEASVKVDVESGPRTVAPDLVLAEDAPLGVRVVDAAGHGIAGAEVTWAPASQKGCCCTAPEAREEWTNRDGRVPGWKVPEGAGVVSVLATGFAPARREVEATARRDVVVVLAPGTELRGRVLDDAGRPVSGATVEWTDSESPCGCGDARQTDVTDGDGAFRIRDLPPPPLRIAVEAPGRRRTRVDVASATGVVEVRLPAVDPAAERERAALLREKEDLTERLGRGVPEEEADRAMRRLEEIEKALGDEDDEGETK
jgi:RNA polymerase sigma factor (sigma-70 family)